ncbi:MAG: hypothetical protein ACPG75_04985 [Alloalcanivorax venustensis]
MFDEDSGPFIRQTLIDHYRSTIPDVIEITDGDGGSAFTTGSRAACERASDASRILEDVGMELDDAEMVEAILSRYVDEMVAMDAPVSEHLAGLAERILGACHQRGVVFRSDGRPVKVSVPTD